MILQNKIKGNLVKNEIKEQYVVDEKIEPLTECDLDKLISDLNKVEMKEEQIGNLVKEPEEKKKALSALKHVNGVLDYFQQIKKDKVKSALPKYLYDLTLDILKLNKCQNYASKNQFIHTRFPLIVINGDIYDDFILFLSNYYQYEEYKKNTVLLQYLILSTNAFDKYEQFHDCRYNYTFSAECINTGLVDIYDIDQITKMNQKLKKYFDEIKISGISIDLYYDKWIKTVMEILFNYLLFSLYETPVITVCEKCKKMVMFIQEGFDLCSPSNILLYDQLYEDIKDNETYPKSIDIANNIMNNLDMSNAYFNYKENKVKDTSSLNIIYYDENMINNYQEVVQDSLSFEKECNGTFLLISNIPSFILILKEFKRYDQYPRFHLICTGSKFENLMKNLEKYKDIHKIIVSAVIYTMNAEKYAYLKQKYKIIQGIYVDPKQIIEYIRKNKSNKNIKYKVSSLISFDEYNEKYIEFHKIISLQYGKLYQKSSYLTALNILEEYLLSDKNNKMDPYDLKLFLSNLEVFSRGPKDYKKIIKEYTSDTFYRLFNKWLYETDPLAIRKIAFFISGLQLSLNIYGMKENKGFNCKAQIYRGSVFDYSLILNYIKNIGKIITFPSFFSTTLDVETAKDFSRFYESKEERNGLFSTNYIININPRNNWIAQGFNINEISHYQKEREILFQPFCFFILNDVKVDIKNCMCYIYMELIGKKEIWEKSMNSTSNILYIKNENVIELNKIKQKNSFQ